MKDYKTMMKKYFTGLWRDPNFLKLWAGETISLFGSQVTFLGLPLVAALTLSATPLQMGTLGMVQFIPWLLIGLFAGAWADRLRRRPIMILADLGRAALLGFIPLFAMFGTLKMSHLYLVGFLVGILNVFFEVAYTAYLPTLVPQERLVEGNSKLQTSASVAEIGGPGLAGGLIQWVNAPAAIVVDALSFILSALSLIWIRTPEPQPARANVSRNLLAEIRQGLRLLFSNPILRAFAVNSTIANFFVDMHLAVFVLYATRELGMTPLMLGGMYAVTSVGGLIGSLLAERLAKRAGLGRIIVGAQILFTLAMLTIPLAGYQFQTAVPIIVAAQALWGFATVVYVVNTVSLRQRITPNQFQGRVAASLRFVTWGISPLGFLAGGLLGGSVGLQATLLVSGIGPILSIAVLIFSPVPGLREPFASESIPSPTTIVT